MPIGSGCDDVWWQYAWQANDRVSREDLADAISRAEEDIAQYLGYYPAPKFISREMHRYPRHHRPDLVGSGLDVRYDAKSVKLRWGRFIGAGRRYASSIGEATVAGGDLVYSDEDGDGYSETATITLPTILSDSSKCQIKVFFDGYSDDEWEIRPARSIEIVGGNVVITFWAWQLINPDLWEALPVDLSNRQALTITDDIYVDTVDVYRVYPDYSQHSAEFYWEPRYTPLSCPGCGGTGCPACQLTVQCGCLHVRDVDRGIAVPTPASWNASTESYDADKWTLCYEPDNVKVWYLAGEYSQRFLNGHTCDPLDDQLARAIAYMATARIERPFCNCGNLTALATDLRVDLAQVARGASSYQISKADRDNPFGTRKGEVQAWRMIRTRRKRVPRVAVI
jgi:hypothetical protein